MNPKVQDFGLPQTPILRSPVQLFATGSSELGFRRVTNSHLLLQKTITALSSSVFHSLCLSAFVLCDLQNETLLLSLKYFVLPKTVCILQKTHQACHAFEVILYFYYRYFCNFL